MKTQAPLKPLLASPPGRVLLVCTQRIGDVLLTTPLARSMKQAWPDAAIDALVLPGTEGALAGNPDISRVIALPQRVGWQEKLAQARRLWRRYDLAVSPLATDRARLFCWLAGRRRAGVLQAKGECTKAMLLDRWTTFDDLDTHTVAMGLRLASLLGIAAVTEVVPPSAPWDSVVAKLDGALPARDYAVLHLSPMFRYKEWHSGGWIHLMRWLNERGLTIVLTGGPAQAEQIQAERLLHEAGVPGVNLAGRLNLAQTAELIRRARLFVGPDTAVTHIAAATATPTLALFGPSNPVKWGPWPKDWKSLDSPWPRRGSLRQGNVYLLQGEDPRGCVPCLLEGCERNVASGSQCLLTLSSARVVAAAAALLDEAVSVADSSQAARRAATPCAPA